MTGHPLAQPRAEVDRQAINIRDLRDLMLNVDAALSQDRGFTLFTLNLDHLVKRREDPAFRSLYKRATFVTADGWPVVRLARRQGGDVTRTAGADLIVPLCELAARRGIAVALFGSTERVLLEAADRLCRMVPNLVVAASEAPPFGFDPHGDAARDAIARTRASGARICFLALGAPKQEMLADRALALAPGIGFVCIGAGLDFIAGAQSRAPKLLQDWRLEWAWRLAMQPRRLARRYWKCALVYLRLSLAGGGSSSARHSKLDQLPDVRGQQ